MSSSYDDFVKDKHAMLFSKTKFSVLPCSTMLPLFQSKHDELEAKFIEESAVLEAKY